MLKSSTTVGLMTLLSRILGLARDMVWATFFGAGSGFDAFLVAFKIPNFFRKLFAEGAFAQAFVPVLVAAKTGQSHQAVAVLVNRVAGSLGLSVAIVTGLAMVFAPYLAIGFALGFSDDTDKITLTGDLLRITFPYLFFISLTAFAGGVLNSYQQFAVPAFTPVILNLVLIAATLLLTPYFHRPEMGLAWGVFLAGIAQLLFQLPFLRKIQLLPRPTVNFNDPGVRNIIVLMGPSILVVGVTQINLLLDTLLASFLPDGSIGWLYYSERLSGLPMGLLGIAVATVILPRLSQLHAEQQPEHFAHTLNWGLRMTLIFGLPAMLALLVLAQPLIISLFQYGALTDHDVSMSALSLRAYAVGVLAFMWQKVLTPGYFARHDMKTPMRYAIVILLVNMVLNLLLWQPMQHAGLALATSLSALLGSYLLLRGLLRAKVFFWDDKWRLLLPRLLVANVGLLLALYWVAQNVVWGILVWWLRIGSMLLVVAGGVVVYIGLLWMAGLRFADLSPPAEQVSQAP